MKRLLLFVAFAALAVFPATAAGDLILKVSDHGSTCFVTNSGSAVECTGKLSGLGSSTTNITVTVPAGCTNNGGNNPPGQASGSSGPIQPQNGQVVYDVTTGSLRCPDDMTPFFGPTATITVTQGGVTVFTEQVPISH